MAERRRRKDIDQTFQAAWKSTNPNYDNHEAWTPSLGDLSSNQIFRGAWSDDESVSAGSSNRYNKIRGRGRNNQNRFRRRTGSYNRSSKSMESELVLPSLDDWYKFTSSITNLVQTQINNCTGGAQDSLKDDSFTLKDEDFFWHSSAQSFETNDTRKTPSIDLRSSSSLSAVEDFRARHARRMTSPSPAIPFQLNDQMREKSC